MKNYVSNNFKYFKNSKANSAFGHVLRTFQENKNAFAEYTKDNFGTGDLLNKYKNIYEKVNERKAELKLKRLNDKTNCFIDGAFSFSLEQWEKLEKENTKEELEQKITERMNLYMSKFKDQFGFEPIGFEMHLDEGHEKNHLIRNIHAHVSFFNYDFEKDCAPLRAMKKKDWSKCQDLAAECFEDLGFQRGISKDKTKKQHLDKDAFIAEKQKKQEEELKQKDQRIKKLEEQVKVLEVTKNTNLDIVKETSLEMIKVDQSDIDKVLKSSRTRQKKLNNKVEKDIISFIENIDEEKKPQNVDSEKYQQKNIKDGDNLLIKGAKILAQSVTLKYRKETPEEINQRLINKVKSLGNTADTQHLERQLLVEKAKNKKAASSFKSLKAVKNISMSAVLQQNEELKEQYKDLENNSVSIPEYNKLGKAFKILQKNNQKLENENNSLKSKLQRLGKFIIKTSNKLKSVFYRELLEHRENNNNNIVHDCALSFKETDKEQDQLFEIDNNVDLEKQLLKQEKKKNNEIEEPENIKKYDNDGNEIFNCGACSKEIKSPGLCSTCKGSAGGSSNKM